MWVCVDPTRYRLAPSLYRENTVYTTTTTLARMFLRRHVNVLAGSQFIRGKHGADDNHGTVPNVFATTYNNTLVGSQFIRGKHRVDGNHGFCSNLFATTC